MEKAKKLGIRKIPVDKSTILVSSSGGACVYMFDPYGNRTKVCDSHPPPPLV